MVTLLNGFCHVDATWKPHGQTKWFLPRRCHMETTWSGYYIIFAMCMSLGETWFLCRLPTVDRFKTIKQQMYTANDIYLLFNHQKNATLLK